MATTKRSNVTAKGADAKAAKNEPAAQTEQTTPARGEVGFSDARFWAFLFDWQFYILMILAMSFPLAHYLQPYIGEDNAALFRIAAQLAFVLYFFHYMGRRNEQLGFI